MAEKKEFRKEKVLTLVSSGLRVYRDTAFVRKDEFSHHGLGDLGTPECTAKVYRIPSYESGELVEGTLLEFHQLPKGCKFETVQAFTETGRLHEIELLGPRNTFRKEQAAERYAHTVGGMIERRVPGMRGLPGTAHSAPKLRAEYQAYQAQLALENKNAEKDGKSGRVIISTRSSMDNDDGGVTAGAVVSKGRGRGAKPAAGGQKGGRRDRQRAFLRCLALQPRGLHPAEVENMRSLVKSWMPRSRLFWVEHHQHQPGLSPSELQLLPERQHQGLRAPQAPRRRRRR